MVRKRRKKPGITTLIGHGTELRGDMRFSGGLHVDGSIVGNVLSEDPGALLTLSEQGAIEGDVRVPRVVISGTVTGSVHASNHIELLPSARITGSVYYTVIEMAMGAEVNGNLVKEDLVDQNGHEPLELKTISPIPPNSPLHEKS
uniref:Protein CcmA, bactofilin family n=1 Tax=Candidatus Kentrum sp. SD TaxID=2126332 RepID=A0A450YBL9_9GAMM|nr:MAG: protein CcmA, bactofilin family [Candidatus Kentron sp. SD]VFK43219.1 MAG: protein CcmA, bactofilin family [Candidatus Kentron sp. SD]VFK78990.1 MAG: protein CcmA, bactofilin family [Candidatus Kentron sp. SD]